MKNLGNYTLGDEYVSPQNRLSRQLMQQGSQGGPSHSWQETLGRIAQQLSGAYMGMQDQKQQDAAISTIGKQQPDTFTNMPTLDDEQIMNSQGIRDILTAKTDEDFMQNPQIQNAMRGIGGSQDQINQEESFIKNAQDQQIKDKFADAFGNESRGRYVNPEAADREISMGRESIGRANANIDQQSEVFNAAMSRMRGNQPTQDQRGDMVAAELQKQRQASMQPTLDAKMPQRDFMIKNLQAMPNNTYAKRYLAQALMQGMDQDYTAGLANTARSQQLDDATLLHNRGMEKDKAQYAMKPPASRESQAGGGLTQNQNWVGGEWANAGDPYDKNFRSPESQKQAMERSTASKQYWNPAVFQEKEEIKENVKSDSYSKKPMPTSAVKLQDEHIAAISTSKGLTADLGKWDKMITSGDLDLGYFSNPLNAAKTYTGVMSDEQSRNYSSFKTSLEKMRNESLRLNKGIQTEGDAQRIWNELISNISDEEFVSQRLKELQAVNQRAVELRKYQIDSIRNNFGKGPMDEAPEPTAIPGTGGASVDFVYIPGQGLVPEKRGK